jgi:hypothetical protein
VNRGPQFAPVASLEMHRILHEKRLLGGYLLLLAHKILERPREYGHFYHQVRQDNKGSFFIMDNSLIELGTPLEPSKVAEAAMYVRADCIVLPDKLLDAEFTIEASSKAASKKVIESLPHKCFYMGVVQGRTEDEVLRCAEHLWKLPYVGYFAVPRILTKQLGTRMRIVSKLYEHFPATPIHLLGFSVDIPDDLDAARLPGVMGIDSSMPVRLGEQGLYIFDYCAPNKPVPPRPAGYLENEPKWDIVIQSNLSLVRSVLSIPLEAAYEG